ncbi:MAG: LEPR-XLL domain-containing protein, partial [Candidatus Accumulibacter sp.]|uniref:LEPR-XLL domain-containing protein n=1 Tax=Accumulibacter sp. TaxID=2053492 RepID=UPI001A3A6DD2
MRRSAKHDERSPLPRRPGPAPLLSALRDAFSHLTGKPPGPVTGRSDSRLHWEPLEPRLLLSGDPLALPELLDGTAGVATEVHSAEPQLSDTTRVLMENPGESKALAWSLTAGGQAFAGTSEPAPDRTAAQATGMAQAGEGGVGAVQGSVQASQTFFDADFNADGRRDLFAVSHRADGRAVGQLWLATEHGLVEGDSVELGA